MTITHTVGKCLTRTAYKFIPMVFAIAFGGGEKRFLHLFTECGFQSILLICFSFVVSGVVRSGETKNLIYLIQCNCCNLQYIGGPKRRLKDRFNEHRRTIDNPNTKCKPTTAAEHFLTAPNHTANNMQLIPI